MQRRDLRDAEDDKCDETWGSEKHWLNVYVRHKNWSENTAPQNVLNVSGFNLRSSNLYDSIVYA